MGEIYSGREGKGNPRDRGARRRNGCPGLVLGERAGPCRGVPASLFLAVLLFSGTLPLLSSCLPERRAAGRGAGAPASPGTAATLPAADLKPAPLPRQQPLAMKPAVTDATSTPPRASSPASVPAPVPTGATAPAPVTRSAPAAIASPRSFSLAAPAGPRYPEDFAIGALEQAVPADPERAAALETVKGFLDGLREGRLEERLVEEGRLGLLGGSLEALLVGPLPTAYRVGALLFDGDAALAAIRLEVAASGVGPALPSRATGTIYLRLVDGDWRVEDLAADAAALAVPAVPRERPFEPSLPVTAERLP